MATWVSREYLGAGAADDFEREMAPVTEGLRSGLSSVRQGVGQLAQTAQQALPSFALPSLDTLDLFGGGGPAASPQGAASPAAALPQAPPAPAFSLPSLDVLDAFAPKPEPPAPAEALTQVIAPPGPAGTAVRAGAALGERVGQAVAPRPSGPPGAGEIESYIRSSAQRRGIDPDTAVRVAESEGGLTDPVRQSDVVNKDTGQREPSFGPFQLYLGGGLGNEAQKRGIDPRNPAQWREAVDFALDQASRSGWGQWYGAARVGIGPRQGIGGAAQPAPAASQQPLAAPGAAPARPSAQTAGSPIRVVPAAQPHSYWTAGGTHGGAPAADIFAPLGAPIVAPVSGTSRPAVYPSGGNATILEGDDGRFYYLAHGHVPFVGGRVAAGQPIGQVGQSGNARGTSPHLHYAIASSPSVFDQKNGSGDIEGDAYWQAPAADTAPPKPAPVAQAAPAAAPAAPPQHVAPADATAQRLAARAADPRMALMGGGQSSVLSAQFSGLTTDDSELTTPAGYNDPTMGGTLAEPLPAGPSYNDPTVGDGSQVMGDGGRGAAPPTPITHDPSPTYNDPTDLGTQTQPIAPPPSPLQPVWDMAGNVIGAVNTGLSGGTEALLGPRERRLRWGQTLRENTPDLGIPTPAEALAPIDVLTGAPSGTALQAAQDVSGALGPERGILPVARSAARRAAPAVAETVAEAGIPAPRVPAPGEMQLGSGMVPDVGDGSQVLGVGGASPRPPSPMTQHPSPTVVPGNAAQQGIDALYHETSPRDAFMLTSAVGTNDLQGRYVSTDPSFALGQGRQGAVVELGNTQEIALGRGRQKPGLAMMETAGEGNPEYVVTDAPQRTGQYIRSITVAPDARMDPVARGISRGLERDGWLVETLPDGARRFTPPSEPQETMVGSGLVPSAVRAPLSTAAQGAFVGAGSEELQAQQEGRETDRAEQLRRAGIGAVLGVGVGMRAGGRAARAGQRALGSGVVPEPRDAAAISRAQAAERAAAAGRLPSGAQAIRMTPAEEVGRLRLDKFPEPLRPAIQAAAERTGFAHEARRGVIPDAAAEAMADDVNRSVDTWIAKSKTGQSLNTEETRALRNLVTGQAAQVDALTREIEQAEQAGVVTDLLITRAYTEAEKLADLVSVMEGARAEAGRGLRAWRTDPRPTDPTDAAARIFAKFGGGPEGRARALEAVKTFNQIPRDDPIQQAKFWAQIEKGGTITASDVLIAIRYNSMLSSPRTWEIGWVGSVLQAPLKVASDIMAAVSRPTSGELGEAAKGAAMGIRAGLRPLWETVWHGVTTEQALAGQLPRGLAARAQSTPGRYAGTLIDLPGRMVAAPDAFFTAVFGQAEKGRQAAIAAHKQGLRGEARDAFISEFMQNTPKAAQAEVDRVVDGLMLRGEMGRIGKFVTGAAAKDPLIASFIAPFMKVSYHIWSQGVELTPLGALGTAVDVARGRMGSGPYARGVGAGQAAPRVRPLAERLRYNALGLGITGAATWQALHGNVSGIGPDDPEQRDELRATGWQPYSLKLGDHWVSYANWGSVAVPFALAAAYAENQQYKKPDASTEDQMFDMVKRVSQLVTEQTFLQGVGGIMQALEDPQRHLPQLLAQNLASLVPYGSALNTLGQVGDPYQRRAERPADVGIAESLWQSMQGRLPINSLTPDRGDIPIAQDVLGRPVPNPQQGLMGLQPFRVSDERPDPVIQAYLDAGVDIGRPPTTVGGHELSGAEQRRYQQIAGQIIQTRTQEQLAGLRFLPPAEQQKKLRGILTDARAQAAKEVTQLKPAKPRAS